MRVRSCLTVTTSRRSSAERVTHQRRAAARDQNDVVDRQGRRPNLPWWIPRHSRRAVGGMALFYGAMALAWSLFMVFEGRTSSLWILTIIWATSSCWYLAGWSHLRRASESGPQAES